jgi:hypothetical protein
MQPTAASSAWTEPAAESHEEKLPISMNKNRGDSTAVKRNKARTVEKVDSVGGAAGGISLPQLQHLEAPR